MFTAAHSKRNAIKIDPKTATLEQCQSALNILFDSITGKAGTYRASNIVVENVDGEYPIHVRQGEGASNTYALMYFMGNIGGHIPNHNVSAYMDMVNPVLTLKSLEALAAAINQLVKNYELNFSEQEALKTVKNLNNKETKGKGSMGGMDM